MPWSRLTGDLLQVPGRRLGDQGRRRRAYERVREGETVELRRPAGDCLPVRTDRAGPPGQPERHRRSTAIDLDVVVDCSTGTYVVRWPGTSAPRSASVGTSPRSRRTGSARSTWPTRSTSIGPTTRPRSPGIGMLLVGAARSRRPFRSAPSTSGRPTTSGMAGPSRLPAYPAPTRFSTRTGAGWPWSPSGTGRRAPSSAGWQADGRGTVARHRRDPGVLGALRADHRRVRRRAPRAPGADRPGGRRPRGRRACRPC